MLENSLVRAAGSRSLFPLSLMVLFQLYVFISRSIGRQKPDVRLQQISVSPTQIYGGC